MRQRLEDVYLSIGRRTWVPQSPSKNNCIVPENLKIAFSYSCDVRFAPSYTCLNNINFSIRNLRRWSLPKQRSTNKQTPDVACLALFGVRLLLKVMVLNNTFGYPKMSVIDDPPRQYEVVGLMEFLLRTVMRRVGHWMHTWIHGRLY